MRNWLLIAFIVLTLFGCKAKTLFDVVESSHSGIVFNNIIGDNDSMNVLDVENIYNGGGIGIADFNNDGLQDIYFTGNAVPNKMYLNKGDFKFEDVTDAAMVNGTGRWCRGVAVVDINNDGLMDLYVCATLDKNPEKRKNLLYINTGAEKNSIPRFKEMAAEYGLADTSHTTMAAFFDYDNDGDLDVYLVTNEIVKNEYPNKFRPPLINGESINTDKLLKNDWDSVIKHPKFIDISKQAGISIEGYGHGLNICDINKDGWKDIYVTNDFLPNNTLYINNKNGTFTDQSASYFKHTSANSMGQDVVDINNDGLADIIEADMNPEDNYRKKMMLGTNSYNIYQNSEHYGYQYQYVRNVLQINQGPRVLQNDSIGTPIFSDIAFMAGVAETDWSWTPLVNDFDNDGYRDIIITNGFPKDVTDHDFISFRDKAFSIASKSDLLAQVPVVKIPNYAFKNKGGLSFENVTDGWGLNTPSFSNGAAYADFDNDGDLDVIINNINDIATLYKNNQQEIKKDSSNYITVQFKGSNSNKNGIGAIVELHYGKGKLQVWENTPYRGYLSTMQGGAHFGLGAAAIVDSIMVQWPDGNAQLIKNVAANQVLTVDIDNANAGHLVNNQTLAANTLFTEISDSVGMHYIHQERDFVDFNIQKLLPHKLSEYGPALAAGDINGDGLDDLIAGGAFGYSAQVFNQQKDGRFKQKSLLDNSELAQKKGEDLGVLLFDADGDNDLDLYMASGGYEQPSNSVAYADKFYTNDGKGNFTIDSLALPQNFTSKSCVRAADYDKDGDLDLFIAGRVDPWKYPKPVSSFIYRNDSKNGAVRFTDVTNILAKELNNIGLVCDALFTDFNNDGWIDLILVGEWMPLTFLQNEKGVFKNITAATGITNKVGWWNTIASGDFDNDGDLDYIAGNTGLNTFYRASDKYSVAMYAKDFDNNDSYDAFPSLYLPTSQADKTMKEYPGQTRDDIVKQMISMRSKFQNYKSFGYATMSQLFSPEQLQGALVVKANYLQSSFIRNNGNGKFTITPLPAQAQVSALNGMVVDDFNGDGNLDVLLNGNDYGTEVSVGRYDALNGLLLQGNGTRGFLPLSILESGVYIPGNGKGLVKLRNQKGEYLLAASQNRGPLKIMRLKKAIANLAVLPTDTKAVVTLKNGVLQIYEFNYGSSFLSQSARFLSIGENVATVTVTDVNGKQRRLK